jgi:CRISPR system Cascade subunit CasE
MYLSRLILNPRNRLVQEDMADCAAMHTTVMKAFPRSAEIPAREHWQVLYRADIHPRTGKVTLLVQSGIEPNWKDLPPGYVLNTTGNHPVKCLDQAHGSLERGRLLVFRLRANPTKRLFSPRESQMHGKRVELRTEEEQIAWLERKADGGGFALVRIRTAPDIANTRVEPGNKCLGRRADAHLTFGSVLFEGELEVTDAAVLRQTLRAGIGPGKAYGFGLLSVAPARSVTQPI